MSYIRRPVHTVLAVTPHRPGIVEIGGVSIDLSSGWRGGTENAGIGWTITSQG